MKETRKSPDNIGEKKPRLLHPHLSVRAVGNRTNCECAREGAFSFIMGPKDRDYFVLRAEQELDAAAHSRGAVRGRHEELAWLYQMRINYIDRGLFGDTAEVLDDAPQAEPLQRIIVPA